MLNEQTLATLNALRLFGMAKSFSDKISHPHTADLSHQEFFGLIVQDEKTYRENLRLKRLLHNAKLKQQAALERHRLQTSQRPKQTTALGTLLRELALPSPKRAPYWPHRGGQKLYRLRARQLRCPLGTHRAVSAAPRLFETLLQSKADGSHLKTLTRLAKIQLLILDDLFLTALSDPERNDILEIIEDRHRKLHRDHQPVPNQKLAPHHQ